MFFENYSVNYRDIGGKLTYNGETVVDYNIQCPQVAGRGESLRRINRLFTAKAGAVLENAWVRQYPAAIRQYRELWRINSFEPLNTSLSCEIMYQRENMFSLFCDGFENNRSQGVKLYRESFTWNIARAELLPIWAFFKTNMWKNILIGEIARQIDAVEQETPGSFYRDVKGKLGAMGGYYLTDEGFAVYYPCGFISSNAGALPTFIIPYEKVSAILIKPL